MIVAPEPLGGVSPSRDDEGSGGAYPFSFLSNHGVQSPLGLRSLLRRPIVPRGGVERFCPLYKLLVVVCMMVTLNPLFFGLLLEQTSIGSVDGPRVVGMSRCVGLERRLVPFYEFLWLSSHARCSSPFSFRCRGSWAIKRSCRLPLSRYGRASHPLSLRRLKVA